MIGQTISHYSVLEKLGEGGMGVVYKAQDLTLDRLVALKFLPESSSSGSDTSRFIQEAKAAAALNHPNICTIHGIEEADSPSSPLGTVQFIVMEFVDGQMLEEKKSSLSIKQAIDIGVQVADGLAAAHEKGVVHRDIKPENIMISKDGIVQVMDFGLAKLRGVSRLTKEGSTVGTAGYMSPEQVQGQETDHRSDIFSLGIMLYEMIAGQPPFKGLHETAMAYEIVNVDPQPPSTVRTGIDPALDAIILDCLTKDPKDRCQSAAEVARNLRRFRTDSGRMQASRIMTSRTLTAGTSPSSSSGIRTIMMWFMGALTLLSLSAAFYYASQHSDGLSESVRASIIAPAGTKFHPFGWAAGPAVVSPDGRMLVFSAMTAAGTNHLYLRRLETMTSTEIPGSEEGYYPFWSPDSRWIAFFSIRTGKLKKADIFGNPPVSICDALNCRGGTWNENDIIVFSPGASMPLVSVSASGGTPLPVTRIDTARNESSQRWPSFLPDGRHFLYFSRTISYGAEAEGDHIAVGSLDGGSPTYVVQSTAQGQFASGQLLYTRGSSLIAQPFDAGNHKLSGDYVTIAENVTVDPGFSLAAFSASHNGVLAFHTGAGVAGARMAIVGVNGTVLSYVGEIVEHFTPRLSPDNSRVAFSLFDPRSRTQNLWIHDFSRGTTSRLTSGIFTDLSCAWSPDGRRIAFVHQERGNNDIRVRPVTGGSEEMLVQPSSRRIFMHDWSPDGRTLAISMQTEASANFDLFTVSLDGPREPKPFKQSPFPESDGKFSPDGKWIAFNGSQTGGPEVYIKAFPPRDPEIRVSATGGTLVGWSANGRELYYVNNDNALLAVEIRY